MNRTRCVPIPAQRCAPEPPAAGSRSRTDRAARRMVDAEALRLWLLTRLSVFLLVGAGAWMLAPDNAVRHPISYLARWNQWDTVHYTTIAQFGYDGNPAQPGWVPLEAFFPGYPLVLRVVHSATGLNYVAAGLAISLFAGAVASIALARIALDYAGPGDDGAKLAERTVMVFLISPTTVFLSAAYTESLFLALALTAWLAARHGRWGWAGLLAGGASLVKFYGVLLAIALIVEYFTQRDRDRDRSRWTALQLAVPFLPFLGYMAWLYHRTGDWMYWRRAEERGWGRHTVWPWQGLHNALSGHFDGRARTDFAWMYLLDIATLAVGVALTVWLVRHRRWAETTFVGLQVASLCTTSLWQSFPRFALAWWPLWIVLASWSLRRPAVFQALWVLLAPLAVTFTLMFSTGRWAG
jgi:hypothetical protein